MGIPFVESAAGTIAEQSVGAVVDYELDWSAWLALAPGDVLASSVWSGDAGVTLSNDSVVSPKALVRVSSDGSTPGAWYVLENTVTASPSGRSETRVVMISVKLASTAGSALFPRRVVAIAKMRRDRLLLLANSILPGLTVTDDYIWDKLVAAEAHIAHSLRVPLCPTHFFPRQPTADEIAALAGQPWAIDPSYDYNPHDYDGDKWGLIATRQKPIQSVIGMRFVYPTPQTTIVQVPHDWIRMDGKYGQIQLVPTGAPYPTLLGGLFLSHFSGGKTLPFTVDLEYVAGLTNVERDYPDLIDAVLKLATVKIIEDAFMPQSGSISADGLSQSLSVDVSKYHDSIERILNGADGNGGLMARIHGIRMLVV